MMNMWRALLFWCLLWTDLYIDVITFFCFCLSHILSFLLLFMIMLSLLSLNCSACLTDVWQNSITTIVSSNLSLHPSVDIFSFWNSLLISVLFILSSFFACPAYIPQYLSLCLFPHCLSVTQCETLSAFNYSVLYGWFCHLTTRGHPRITNVPSFDIQIQIPWKHFPLSYIRIGTDRRGWWFTMVHSI